MARHKVTHCIRGHEYTPENTIWQKARSPTRRPERKCRECARIRRRGEERYKKLFSGKLGKVRGQDRIFCKRGHAMTEENKETKIINGRSYTLCRECKKARIVDFDLASIKEKVASLVAFLQEGGTVFAARDNIVSQYEWLAIRKQQPKLASRLRLMSRKNSIARRKNAFQNGTLRWVGATNSNVPSPVVRNWSDREIVEAATNAVPRYIPVDDRQEIIAAMVLACIEGGLTPNAMAKRWIEFRKEHTKFYNPRFNPLAADRQRHLPVLSMEGTMLFSQDSDGVALGTTLSNGFWNTSLNPEEFLIAKEGELT